MLTEITRESIIEFLPDREVVTSIKVHNGEFATSARVISVRNGHVIERSFSDAGIIYSVIESIDGLPLYVYDGLDPDRGRKCYSRGVPEYTEWDSEGHYTQLLALHFRPNDLACVFPEGQVPAPNVLKHINFCWERSRFSSWFLPFPTAPLSVKTADAQVAVDFLNNELPLCVAERYKMTDAT